MGAKYKPGWREVVLRHVRNGNPVERAAVLARVPLSQVFSERRRDAEFRQELEEARANRSALPSW